MSPYHAPTALDLPPLVPQPYTTHSLWPPAGAPWRRYPPFDVAFSISSFEHDGLGRYGDPLNPEGDFRAMKEMAATVAPGGYLILSVPVGADLLAWNCHRVYGRKRLPMLLAGWTVMCAPTPQPPQDTAPSTLGARRSARRN